MNYSLHFRLGVKTGRPIIPKTAPTTSAKPELEPIVGNKIDDVVA